MATSDQVQQLYITYFGRPADPSGLAYWTADAATPLSVIADGFATTPEFTADITGRTLDQIVNSFYVDLFGRNAEPAGLTFWVNQIQIGNTTIQQAGLEISNAALTPEARGNADNVALTSKIAAADQWTATTAASTEATLAYTGNIGIDAGVNYLLPVVSTATIPTEAATEAQIAALVQSNGSGVGSTLELSIFADVASETGTVRLNNDGSVQETSAFRFTAGNQTVNGTANTFSGAINLADRLVDGFTTDQDVLNVTGLTTGAAAEGPGAAAGGPARATVTNIENVNFAFTSAAGNDAAGFAGFTGVQAFTFSGSVNDGGNLGLTMANTGATSFTSALTGDNLSTFTLTTGAAAETITTSDIADNITSDGGNDTIVSAGGNDTVNAGAGNDLIESGAGGDSITGGAGNDTIDAGTGANVITDAGNGNDTINHSAVGSTVAAAVTGTGTVTVNASEAGFTSTSTAGVNTTVDADGSDAAVTLTGNTGADTLTGGTGNDTITGGAANDNMTGGAGADQFNYVQGALTFAQEVANTGTVGTGVIDVTTDFLTGTDTVNFTVAGAGQTIASAANANANYIAALAQADAAFLADASGLAYFVAAYGAGAAWTSVLFIDSDAAGTGSADGAIQIGNVGAYATEAAALAAITAAGIV